MKWHDSAITRKKIGDASESNFTQAVRCYCGGTFNFIGNLRKGFPDFTCSECGQLVDVKSSPQAERTGNLSVSAIPWNRYPGDMLLCAFINGKWIGEYKGKISTQNIRPFSPTHNSRDSHLGNTEWYLICWRKFSKLTELGYKIHERHK